MHKEKEVDFRGPKRTQLSKRCGFSPTHWASSLIFSWEGHWGHFQKIKMDVPNPLNPNLFQSPTTRTKCFVNFRFAPYNAVGYPSTATILTTENPRRNEKTCFDCLQTSTIDSAGRSLGYGIHKGSYFYNSTHFFLFLLQVILIKFYWKGINGMSPTYKRKRPALLFS